MSATRNPIRRADRWINHTGASSLPRLTFVTVLAVDDPRAFCPFLDCLCGVFVHTFLAQFCCVLFFLFVLCLVFVLTLFFHSSAVYFSSSLCCLECLFACFSHNFAVKFSSPLCCIESLLARFCHSSAVCTFLPL